MNVIDKFLPLVMDNEEEGLMTPILIHEKVTFIYLKHRNIYCIRHIERGVVMGGVCVE